MDKYIALLEDTGASARELFDTCVHEFALAATAEGVFAAALTLFFAVLALQLFRASDKAEDDSDTAWVMGLSGLACSAFALVTSIIMCCCIRNALSPTLNIVEKLLD